MILLAGVRGDGPLPASSLGRAEQASAHFIPATGCSSSMAFQLSEAAPRPSHEPLTASSMKAIRLPVVELPDPEAAMLRNDMPNPESGPS